jgi:redox-sensitive bicupin YhaK (pirin superfamily)
MPTLRSANSRGRTRFGWLDSWHSFSFGRAILSRQAPFPDGYRSLRVINDDIVAGGGGFPMHPHEDMEIITYVVSGALAHRDSTGTSAIIQPGEIQRMTAGAGIEHSEFNASQTEPVRLLQIWIQPGQRALTPGYAQARVEAGALKDGLRLIAGPAGAGGAIDLNADARVYSAKLAPGQKARLEISPGRGVWVQMVNGAAAINGFRMGPGDGAALEDEHALEVTAETDAELLMFDLP